jgi:Ca2+-binding RTX toxin-like protein
MHYDVLIGGDGNDQIWGGLGRDTVYMGRGDDVFHDHAQNDFNGADRVYGGEGADIINGGGGADVLDGGADDDMLTGGVGADIFVFSLAHGEDIITDFRPGEDVIEFQNLDLEWSDLHLVMHQNDTVVSSQEGTITLLGVSISEVTAECFAFG